MNSTRSIAGQLLAAALLAVLATPALAQSFHPDKAIKQSMRDAKASTAAAAAAAEAAARQAANQAAAAEKLAADTRAGKIPPPKGVGDSFRPETVKPYVDDLSAIMADLKATTNAAQAIAYAPKFQSVLATVATHRDKALEAFAGSITSGVKTANNDAAEKLMNSASDMAEAIEQDMLRVQTLNPALAADFKKFKDLHDQD